MSAKEEGKGGSAVDLQQIKNNSLKRCQQKSIRRIGSGRCGVKRRRQTVNDSGDRAIQEQLKCIWENQKLKALLTKDQENLKLFDVETEGVNSDSDSSLFHTPNPSLNNSFDNSDSEIEFLHQLAKVLPTATEDELFTSLSVTKEELSNKKTTTKQMDTIRKELQMDIETNTTADPETMQVSSVIAMFNQLKEKIDTESSTQKANLEKFKQECIKDVTEAVEKLQKNETEEVLKLKAQVAKLTHKNEVLTEVCNRMHFEVGDLVQRMDNLELNNSKKSVIISGYSPLATNKTEAIAEIKNFLEEILGFDVLIDDFCYWKC